MFERTPAEAFPLGEHIADELEARGWTSVDLARRMGGDLATQTLTVDLLLHVNDLEVLVGDKTFADLARALDIDEQYLRNLDTAWRKWAWRQKSPGVKVKEVE